MGGDSEGWWKRGIKGMRRGRSEKWGKQGIERIRDEGNEE